MPTVVKQDGSADETTIAAGVTAAELGDKIVEIGDSETYTESFNISIPSNGFIIRVQSGQTPVLDGTSASFNIGFNCNLRSCLFTGLAFQNFGGSGGAIVNGGWSSGTGGAVDCTFTNNRALNRFRGASGNPAVIKRCIFTDADMNYDPSDNFVTFQNCLLDMSNRSGVSGFIASEQSDVNIYFCTAIVTGNSTTGIKGGLVENCITVQLAGSFGTGINCTTANNNFAMGFATNIDASSAESNNIDGDIGGYSVADVWETNYSVLNTSGPCVDVGKDISGITLDLLSNTRASPPDLGAYEVFVPPVPVVDTATSRNRLLLANRHPQSGRFSRIYPVQRRI